VFEYRSSLRNVSVAVSAVHAACNAWWICLVGARTMVSA
jgi:hypothetical protein